MVQIKSTSTFNRAIDHVVASSSGNDLYLHIDIRSSYDTTQTRPCGAHTLMITYSESQEFMAPDIMIRYDRNAQYTFCIFVQTRSERWDHLYESFCRTFVLMNDDVSIVSDDDHISTVLILNSWSYTFGYQILQLVKNCLFQKEMRQFDTQTWLSLYVVVGGWSAILLYIQIGLQVRNIIN